jgi:hypothetical protein
MDILKFLAFVGVILLGGWFKWGYFYKKPYTECSAGERQIRWASAVICGVCVVVCLVLIIMKS